MSEKSRTIWTVLAGIVFVLAFVVFVLTLVVRRDLLSPDLYTQVFTENDVYERIYTEVLADPAVQQQISEATGIRSDLIVGELYAQVVGAMYLVLPPSELEGRSTRFLTGLTDYLKGDRPELEEDLGLGQNLTPDVLSARVVRAAVAVSNELIDKATPIVQKGTEVLLPDDLIGYMANFDNGILAPIPDRLLRATVARMVPDERSAVVNLLLGPAAAAASEETRLQIEAALAADDLPSAISLAAGERLSARVTTAITAAQPKIEQSSAVNGVSALAASLGQTRDGLVRNLNIARDYIQMARTIMIIAAIVMVAAMVAIVWLNAEDLASALRAAGWTLVGASAIVMVVWFIGGLIARSTIQAALAAQQGTPGLDAVVDDVVAGLVRGVWDSVWTTAIWFGVLGLVSLAFGYSKELFGLLRRALEPVWEYKWAVLAGIFGIFVLLPLVWRLATVDAREANLPCNGHVELCDRPANEVAYATSHNSMSITEYGWVWPMHDGTLTDQMEAGVRALLIDSHYLTKEEDSEGILAQLPVPAQQFVQNAIANFTPPRLEGAFLCHQFCALGYSEMLSGLSEVRTFLENNPREVIYIVIQDEISPTDTEKVVSEAGLLPYIYDHPEGEAWPTLREMIDNNKRLVIMAENAGPPPDWYTNVWDVTEETPYTFITADQFSCAPNRGDTGKPFFLLNHWIQRGSPNRVDAAIVNDYDFLLARARQCEAERGKMPNFIAVNFYGQGDLMGVVDTLNGFGAPVE